MSRIPPCSCRHRLKFKAQKYVGRRDIARSLLRTIARHGLDNFDHRTLARAYHDDIGVKPSSWHYNWLSGDSLSAWQWLRQHGFVTRAPGSPAKGTHVRNELTEQGIRWLDWTGYRWKDAA